MDQNAVNPQQVQQIMATMIPLIGFFVLIGIALIIVPLWIAFKKAGLAPALSLIALIPTLGIIVALFILAFARWKVVPAPELAGYMPPGGYPPAGGYTAPGAYTSAQHAPLYPPSEPPTAS